MERRKLLNAFLATASLPAALTLTNAATAHASTLEAAGTTTKALERLRTTLDRIASDHMTPHCNPTDLTSRALAAWRDATALTRTRHDNIARVAQAHAAGLLAGFHTDAGNSYEAAAWFRHAFRASPDTDTSAWVRACATWAPLYRGDHERSIACAESAAGLASRRTPTGAFAYDQLARARAAAGDHAGARTALGTAENALVTTRDEADAPPSLIHYTHRQHATYAADTCARIGDTDIARAWLGAVRSTEHNAMNRALADLTEAECFHRDGRTDEAASYARACLQSVSPEHRNDVITGRARELATLFRDTADTASTRELRDYAATYSAAA
ncbi:hypothetical protein [Streptomyces sp. TR02-1]|uniref:hypothetical protein n=1 Tax=Streptomyces sp. TR02-1 TaxID=3385977 RepID=UPI0039A35370